jgi:hypothetical protein
VILVRTRSVFGLLLANAVDELHTGTYQRQEAGAIEAPPALLGHVEQLERHQQALGPGARAPGRPFPQPHGGKRRLDDIGGAQLLPVLGGKVEEGNQALPIGQRRVDRLGLLGLWSCPGFVDGGGVERVKEVRDAANTSTIRTGVPAAHIELARAGRPIQQLARELEPSANANLRA